jgi:hypothetical protein
VGDGRKIGAVRGRTEFGIHGNLSSVLEPRQQEGKKMPDLLQEATENLKSVILQIMRLVLYDRASVGVEGASE